MAGGDGKTPGRRGGALTRLGALLLAGALGLTGYNLWDGHRGAAYAARVAKELTAATGQVTSPVREAPAEPSPAETEDLGVEIDGHIYIGVLEIPALGLTLPVMGEWSYANLKLAPCRYTGSAEGDDLIIAGHNYRGHFGPLGRLTPGDEVSFTDSTGLAQSYQVSRIEELPGTAVEEMAAGDWDLTLFTCTPGGKARVTVRCERAERPTAEPGAD